MLFESGRQYSMAEAYPLPDNRRNGRKDRNKQHNHQYPEKIFSEPLSSKNCANPGIVWNEQLLGFTILFG